MKENESGRGDPGRSRSPEGRERRITLVWIFLHGQFLSASHPGGTDSTFFEAIDYICTGIIYFQIIIADLEAEIRDSFESEGLTETRVTPKLRRRPRHGFWRSFSRDSCDEMNSSFSSHDNETGSTSGSNKSSRRSSIVSMIQRRMSRGETRFKN